MITEDGAVFRRILRDMSEGVMTIGMDGMITTVNPAALRMLGLRKDPTGRRFGSVFFEYSENDAFNQLVLDAVYDTSASHEGYVPFFTGEKTLQLRVTTSFMKEGGVRSGVIAVLTDISELSELRDAVKAMEAIRELNGRLELRNRLLYETFGRFLSDDIVRRLLDTPDGLALGGKKQELTVLMSDLRGFTALSERMPAMDLIMMLNHYLGEMTDILQARGGTIIEFIGDGILAVFGAPELFDDHAEKACAAAAEMQAHMPAVNAWNREHGFPELEMGIGVNTGEVIVGNIGSEKRTKYGVTGSAVNLCGRIESYTTGGQVLLSPSVTAAVRVPLEIGYTMEVSPKGAKAPVVLSLLTGVGEPYGVSCKRDTVPPVPLEHSVETSYVRIAGKHVSRERERAFISAVSRDGAVFTAQTPPPPSSDIRLDVGTGLYAKVVQQTGQEFTVRFTAQPEEFSGWLDSLHIE